MPNIQGQYSLQEVSSILNLSPAWINKIQKVTGVVWKETGKGYRLYFDENEFQMISNVRMLRDLDFSLDDIEKVFSAEKRMKELVGTYSLTVDCDYQATKFLIHPFFMVPLCYLNDKNEDGSPLVDLTPEEKKEYMELIKFIESVSKEAIKRSRDLEQRIKRFQTSFELNTNFSKYG